MTGRGESIVAGSIGANRQTPISAPAIPAIERIIRQATTLRKQCSNFDLGFQRLGRDPVLFIVGLISWVIIGMLILCLAVGWFTLSFGEDFQSRYAKGAVWSLAADVGCGGAILLLLLVGKWVGEKTGLL